MVFEVWVRLGENAKMHLKFDQIVNKIQSTQNQFKKTKILKNWKLTWRVHEIEMDKIVNTQFL